MPDTVDQILAQISALGAAEQAELMSRIGEAEHKCWWCERPSTRLCDTLLLADQPEILGDTVSRKVLRHRVLDVERTCDAHICDVCSTSVPVHIAINCGEFDDHGEPIGRTEVDTIDKCPFCAAHHDLHVKLDADVYRERVREHAKKTRCR